MDLKENEQFLKKKEGYKKFGPFHFFQFLEHAARSRASHWISQCDA